MPRLPRTTAKSKLVPFDPFAQIRATPSAMPETVVPVNLRTLTPFQRALLSIDGTVTRFIEAYTMEPTETIRLANSRYSATADVPSLDARAKMLIQMRNVIIRGKYSRTEFVYATSLVVPERLPAPVRDRLLEEGSSIGRLLNEFEIETRREILWFGRERDQRFHDGSTIECSEAISRAYRIIANRQPIALIRERFPDVTGARPAHH